MDEQELIKKLKESGHHRVKVAITDMDGVLRGKYMHRDKLVSALQNGFGFCSVVFGWDMADASYENGVTITGWHTGYPDVGATIDPNTFRTLPWEDDTPFVLADFSEKEGEGLPICPRNLLKKVVSGAAEMGYAPLFSQEFEWFNYRENSVGLHEKNFQRTTPRACLATPYSACRRTVVSSKICLTCWAVLAFRWRDSIPRPDPVPRKLPSNTAPFWRLPTGQYSSRPPLKK